MSPIFFYLENFIFILHHFMVTVKNTFSHILICMLDEIIKKMIIILHSNKKTFFYPQRLIKSLDQKESNTLMKVFYKHHGRNFFGASYQRGIVHAQNYSMHVQYPF